MRARSLSLSPSFLLALACGVVAGGGTQLAGCKGDTGETGRATYFERTIAPVLTTSCTRTATGAGCHTATPKGNAFGNLDTSSFAGVARRRDLLIDYGPYGQPAFLVKAIPNATVDVTSFDGKKVTLKTDIKHTGGTILDPTGTAYQTLRRWIQNGASENNSGPPTQSATRLPCKNEVPQAAGFDATKDPPRGDFNRFKSDARIGATLGACAAGNCHGAQSNDLYLTCGETAEGVRWNYFAARQYLAQTPEASELLRRPLSPSQGGAYHEGGAIFESPTDERYVALTDWAKEHGPADFGALDPNFLFFAHKVQPVLAKKGCMMFQCHAAAQFHDYRLRGGSGGSFSLSATKRNYDLSLAQLSVESADPNASRLIRKNLFRAGLAPGATGIAHRGGPLLEDLGEPPTAALCDAKKLDYEGADVDTLPAYCVLAEWHRRERDARKPAPLRAVLYVQRPVAGGADRPQDFDVYRPGADLRSVAITESGGALAAGAEESLTAKCGLTVATADIRRPQVSWDGARVVFAARSSAAEPFAVYEMGADGEKCGKHAVINAGPSSENGLAVHNFDPTFSPPDDGGAPRIVFASTRGNLDSGPYDYKGPQRTPADPSKPNANLYVLEPDGRVRQLTYLLNLERFPSFMSDGRVIMTTEKRASGFYQLALRRQNLDGGDYHPLFAQRASVGYHEASQVVELADKNFAAIFSEPGAAGGGGALGVFNRSIGIDFQSSKPGDYLLDPSVIDPKAAAAPELEFFLRSLHFVDPKASGRPKEPTVGLFRSPAPLPSGKLLVSFGAAADASTFGGDYDVFVVEPTTGERTKLFGDPQHAEVDAVAVYGRVSRGIFRSALDEPNGHTRILAGKTETEVLVHDMPLFASLVFQNTPTGRPIETFDSFEVWEELPPPVEAGAGSANGKDEFGAFYHRRRLLGRVPLAADGSAKVVMPGGLPIMLKLPESKESGGKLPRLQRESLFFSPGEYAHQSFRRELFDGLCGACHGAVSGRPVDVATRPDILTQASTTIARDSAPTNLLIPPTQRGAVEGP